MACQTIVMLMLPCTQMQAVTFGRTNTLTMHICQSKYAQQLNLL
jgi:hypothetical protein